MSPEALQGFERIRKGQRFKEADGSVKKLTEMAYEMMSLFHETRHFVDGFGTIAGCNLFAAHIERLKGFVKASQELRLCQRSWTRPLRDWVRQDDCPPGIRTFIRYAHASRNASERIICPFEPMEIEGHREDVLIEAVLNEEQDTCTKIDAFPIRAGRFSDKSKHLRTILYPIGMEALTEASAHAFCRNLVAHYFPTAVAKQLEYSLDTFDFDPKEHGDINQVMARRALPYMAVDLLVTRFLRTTKKIDSFPRDLIFAVVDRVLSNISFRLKEVGNLTFAEVDRPGDKLQRVLSLEDPSTLAAGHVSDDYASRQIYQSMVNRFDGDGDWDTIEDDRSPLASLKIWQAYVKKHFMLPLLRERIATKGTAFTTHDGFLRLLNKVGPSPIQVVNGDLHLNLPPRVEMAWFHQVMLSRVLHHLVEGEEVRCPRRFPELPGMESLDLCFEGGGDCDTNAVLGCGEFDGKPSIFPPPKCLFEEVLRVSALQRAQAH
jgi:hypothetical protein